jgi:aspartate racemase
MSTSSEAERQVAGVLGGLGPDATVDFMAKVVAATQATRDQDHIRMIVDHNPTVPNRHEAIAGNSPSVGPQLAAMARGLESSGADFLVMVCNTAHAYTDDIRAAVEIPFVSIVDVTVDALKNTGAKLVGVMAAEGCLNAELYQEALDKAGYETVLWSDSELEEFMELVYRIKAGERDEDIGSALSRLASSLVFGGAEVLIAGCTEIPLFLNAGNTPAPLLSSTDLLVERTIELAGGPANIED